MNNRHYFQAHTEDTGKLTIHKVTEELVKPWESPGIPGTISPDSALTLEVHNQLLKILAILILK
jgi:hypothetical protein